MLVEWLSGLAHSGAATLSLLCAREACRSGGVLVVIDRLQNFYPPAAAGWGIDLQRLVIVRPRGAREALWAAVQSLSSPAVAAVWAPLERLDSREFRQLQLAAQAGRTLGLLLRPSHVRGEPSWADVRLGVGAGDWGLGAGEPASAGGKRGTITELQNANCKMQIANWQTSAIENLQSPLIRFIHVRILRQRGARPGASILLEINDATHTVQQTYRLSALGHQPNIENPQPPVSSPQPPHALPLFMASELADAATRSQSARA
jgi:hypothetical protein